MSVMRVHGLGRQGFKHIKLTAPEFEKFANIVEQISAAGSDMAFINRLNSIEGACGYV